MRSVDGSGERTEGTMKITSLLLALSISGAALAADGTPNPSWWNKYQYLLQHGPSPFAPGAALTVGANGDVSNECGPHSEPFIALDAPHPRWLAGVPIRLYSLPITGALIITNEREHRS